MIKMDECEIVPSQKENNKINVRGYLMYEKIHIIGVVRKEN